MAENMESKATETEEPVSVPYVVFESAQARWERINQKLILALVIAIAAVLISNLVWLYCWMQYDYVSDTVTVESTATGHANYIAGDGDIHNGESSGQETNAD